MAQFKNKNTTKAKFAVFWLSYNCQMLLLAHYGNKQFHDGILKYLLLGEQKKLVGSVMFQMSYFWMCLNKTITRLLLAIQVSFMKLTDLTTMGDCLCIEATISMVNDISWLLLQHYSKNDCNRTRKIVNMVSKYMVRDYGRLSHYCAITL